MTGTLLLGGMSEVAARTWRITPDGGGDAPTVQAGIDSAAAGDVVLLAAGTYTWNEQGGRSGAMLHVALGITLRGESGAASTILDAESQGRVLACSGTAHPVVLEDLAFVNGLAPTERLPLAARRPAGPLAPADSHGGAIEVHGVAVPLIRRCIFRNNRAQGGAAHGGAVCCDDATIEDCEFTGNEAGVSGPTNGFGGAVWCKGARIQRSIFRDNKAWGYEAARGGAVHSVSATIRDCRFEGNRAECPGSPRGGAIEDGGFAAIERCVFRGNGADGHYFSASGGAADAGSATLVDCLFVGNFATCGQGPGQGGALSGDALAVRRCIFIDNEAKRTNPLGAGRGGAIFARFHSSIESCTLIGNGAGTADGIGAIYFEEDGTVQSTIVAFTGPGQTCSGSGTWRCCDLFANAGGNAPCGVDERGNFSADPLLCAADPGAQGDVTVRADSPCLAGNRPTSCEDIGAGGAGCVATRVAASTWSELKRLYR